MSDSIEDKTFDESECNENNMNGETNMSDSECNLNEHVPSAATDSEEEDAPVARSKRRVQRFSDSDEDSDHEGQHENGNKTLNALNTECHSLPEENNSELPEDCNAQNTDDDGNMHSVIHKSRLRKASSGSDSSDSNDAESIEQTKSPISYMDIEDSRIKNKRNKLRDKFKTLVKKRLQEKKSGNDSDLDSPRDKLSSDASQNSEDEASSINILRQKIKEKTMQITNSICDPNTSDEEGTMALAISKPYNDRKSMTMQIKSICDPDTSDEDSSRVVATSKPKKERKSTKPTSPKPIRMSAKQAMENMQKIKSESNRMLREKEVSLPYHRPKALSLKDILSKRRPAVSTDGKALPIKMNEEQLRQYAQQLEQRQKEVIELCKSESEDEPDEPKESEHTLDNTEKKSEDENQNNQDIHTLYDTICNDMTKMETLLDTNAKELTNTVNMIDAEKIHVDETPSNFEPLQIDENIPNEDNIKSMSIDPHVHIHSTALNDSDKNNSAEMELVYNDSVEEPDVADIEKIENIAEKVENLDAINELDKPNTEADSQLISLQYDNTENTEHYSANIAPVENPDKHYSENVAQVENIEKEAKNQESHESNSDIVNNETSHNDDFSDDDINMDDIDALIENAEISTSQKIINNVNSPMLIKEPDLSAKPKLIGTPGMLIDLDGTDPSMPRKLTGIELLKERFVFFSKLKTPEELERDKEKMLKPGALHLKLKQELEEQMAEQRSLEWARRLEEEKQQHKEHNPVKDIGSDAEDIDYIESKLEEKEEKDDSRSESEEEVIEHDIIDKPRKRNPMVDDEAEESDCDEIPDDQEDEKTKDEDEANEADVECNDGEDDEEEDETEESSDESEEEQQNKPRKGRILKAFEDSDDEEVPKIVSDEIVNVNNTDPTNGSPEVIKSIVLKETQDDVIQLAQKSQSEDLFTSQDSKTTKSSKGEIANTQEDRYHEDKDLGSQTFSILDTTAKDTMEINLSIPDKLPMTCNTQAFDDNLDAVVGMCSGSFSQNLVPPSQINDNPESQVLGDDVLALCTGQFYNNQFVSQEDNGNSEGLQAVSQDIVENGEDLPVVSQANNENGEGIEAVSQNDNENGEGLQVVSQDNNENGEELHTDNAETLTFDVEINTKAMSPTNNKDVASLNKNMDSNKKSETTNKKFEDPNLTSILDELNDPEFDIPKPNKYFVSNAEEKENKSSVADAQFKKKFVIDSDDDEETKEAVNSKKIKKKKKMEQRALQISDDEEEDEEFEDDDESESEMIEEDEERIVEYDSDENEVIVQPQNPKKNRKTAEFFENEAELTSEDEWIGSGDEDEAGLDRMEREEGDDDTFNQNQLQRELGQIHMRDVLDQDKREVRLIQELLFEDGDLGGGSRQRKFRWKDIDGEDAADAAVDEFGDTQEDETESEEQWRKQRHEREMFLRSLNNPDGSAETLNISFNRTSMIKANLSKTSSDLFVEVNTSVETTESPAPEKKTAKDIPSPKKPFAILKQNYHGSLLSRGQGALARLAALATPLATDSDAPKVGSLAPTNKRNFVFAAIDNTKDEDEPKVTKRKAEGTVGTPRLVKKLRTEDKQKHHKTSLLDHLKV